MPKLEYRGILARPGPYKYKWGIEVKTWKELKKAFQRTPEIMLTLGHPLNSDGTPRFPNKEDFLGRVIPVVNEERQLFEGIFKFHEEEWDKIPDSIRKKIVNDEAIAISAGFPPPRMEDGEQRDILFNHFAVLMQGENPICPLGECGINVRLESDSGDHIMTYEQATSTRDEVGEEEPAQKKETAAVEQVAEPFVTFTREQFDKLISTLSPQEQPIAEAGAEPLEGKSSDLLEKSEPQVEEPEPEPPREPSLEPERAFPAGKPSKGKSPYIKEDGSVEIPSDIYIGGTKKQK